MRLHNLLGASILIALLISITAHVATTGHALANAPSPCITQPKLTTLAHDVLPAVALPSGYKQTELLNVPGGVYVTWSNSTSALHLTIWRYTSPTYAALREKSLVRADQGIDGIGVVDGVPGSFYGYSLASNSSYDFETLFVAGIYIVRVHTFSPNTDGEQLARDVTNSIYSRLTLITGQ